MSRRLPHAFALGSATLALVVSAPLVATATTPTKPAVPPGVARTIIPAAANCPSPGGMKVAEAPTPTAVVKVFGHGWGHGMGMSQYGAQGAARLGCNYKTILGTYYVNSSLAVRTLDAPVLLSLASMSTLAKLDAEGGTVRWVSGSRSAVQPQGTTWSVTRRTVSGRVGLVLLDDKGSRTMFVPDAGVLSARHTGTVVKVRPTGSTSGLRSRWGNGRFIGSSAGVRVAEVIGSGQDETAVQKYLMGLAEVPVSWPVEALKAQVVAARTYLSSKYSSSDQAYVLKTTTADQVYRGYDQEQADARLGGRWHQAVSATLGKVIVDSSGRTIEAMYSSSMGGHTENRQYVYGRYGISYLKAVDDSRWDNASDNPYRRWSKGFTKKDLAERFGFTSVSAWTVAARGSAARLNGVQITGKRAGRTVTVSFTGTEARGKLGLRSPGFTFGSSVVAPKPKPVPTPTPSPTPTPTVTPTVVPTVLPTASRLASLRRSFSRLPQSR